MWDISESPESSSWNTRKKKTRVQSKAFSPNYQLEVRRVNAEIRQGLLGGQQLVAESRVILSDFSPKGVAMFTSQFFHEGQEVSITIDQPKQFFCKGTVFSCHEYAHAGRILTSSGNSFKYRIHIQFTFDLPEDQKQVLAYCEDLASQNMLILGRPRGA